MAVLLTFHPKKEITREFPFALMVGVPGVCCPSLSDDGMGWIQACTGFEPTTSAIPVQYTVGLLAQ